MATIGKIGIGVNTRLNFHDFKHDVNSTLGFGFCEPTLIHSMHAKSKIDLKTSSVVRLAPLPCPTFGRLKARQDTVFVPMTDVFEAWNEFITGTGYSTANGSGVPTTLDYITYNQLFVLLNTMNFLPNYNAATFKLDNLDNLLRQMFTYSFSINWNPFSDGDEIEQDFAVTEWNDLDTLIMAASTPEGKKRALRFLNEFFLRCAHYNDDESQRLSSIMGFTSRSTYFGRVFSYSSDNNNKEIFTDFTTILHSFIRPSYLRNCDLRDYEYMPQGLANLVDAFNSAPESVISMFDQPRTHLNSDFAFVYAPEFVIHWANKDAFDHDSDDENINWVPNASKKYKVCLNFHLTPYGKRIYKILTAMGVTERYNDNIELSKLFAYFKAWFDLFDPQRNKNWKQTNCYRLIHNFYDYRVLAYDILAGNNSSYAGGSWSVLYDLFVNFIIDLVKCNYFLGADTFTVANRYPLQPANGDINNPAMLQGLNPALYQGQNGTADVSTVALASAGAGRVSQGGGVSPLTSLSVIALERLYYAINKESALASNIEDIMLTRFGVNIKSTRVLGRSDYNIEIDPVYATVNNEQTKMAEYAGKAVASGTSKRIDFTAPVQGYVIQMFSVVPYGGYVQGSTPAQLKRADFYSDYTAMYDSLGYEKMHKSQILGRESVINNYKQDEEFGNVPQLFHLKFRTNLANGGFAFRSERASFLPYSLDRLFSEGDINNHISSTLGQVTDAYSKPIDVVPDPILRTVGLYEGFGNYNRIFYDTAGLADNFILHMIQDLKYYSPMKSVSTSFDTVDHSVDDDTRQAERA